MLTALRHGDFSVRLPASWVGLSGKVGDTFNDVMDQLEGMTNEVDRISRVVGKEGKIKQRASSGSLSGSWAGNIDSVNALISDLVHPTSEMARVIGAVAKGDLSQSMALDIDGRPLEGEFLRTAKTVNRMVDQLGSFASEVTRRGPRSGHRRQARRSGRGEGRGRHVEGSDRQRELDGRQPDRPGAQHRRSDDGRRQRRLVEEDHRRRARRVPGTQEHHQHDGRSAALVRLGSDARGPRSGYRRQARRPGPRGRRLAARGKISPTA